MVSKPSREIADVYLSDRYREHARAGQRLHRDSNFATMPSGSTSDAADRSTIAEPEERIA